MARTTPKVQGKTLTWRTRDQEHNLTVGTPEWYAWLEGATSFAFAGQAGSFTARKERTQRSNAYWRAYRKKDGRLYRSYLGKSEQLSLAHLNMIAHTLTQTLNGETKKAKVPQSPASLPALSSTFNEQTGLLISTKLHPPRPRTDLIHRDHLTAKLEQGVENALTLISAPAGFGKTTLLVDWLTGRGIPVAWLSLETQDNEPYRFFSYLLASLQRVDMGLGTAALSLLQTPQPAPLEALMAILINDLDKRAGGDVALVLDDYHVIVNSSIHQALAFLLDHLPAQMHLLIATRVDPPLPLARLRARGQLTEIRASELRLKTPEAKAFLQQAMGLSLPAEEITALEQSTEGWIAGLQLVALSLRDRVEDREVSHLPLAATESHSFVLDYLSEEVLARQPLEIQTFLLNTSILERFCWRLCNVVTGRGDGQEMLKALYQANLFIISLDGERLWYRYHHLFAQALRDRLKQTSPQLIPDLHRRASAWFEQQGFAVEAVQHGLAAHDEQRAAQLIQNIGMSLALAGQMQTVLGWLDQLPASLVRANPVLCVIYAITLSLTDQIGAAEAWLRDAEQALAEPPIKPSILGYIVAVRANLARSFGDRVHSIRFSQQALELLSEEEVLLRTTAHVQAAHGYLLDGDVRSTNEDIVVAAIEAARISGNRLAALTSITNLACLRVLQGHLHLAMAIYEQAMQNTFRTEELRLLPSGPTYYFGLGEIFLEQNNLQRAKQALEQGVEVVKTQTMVDADFVTRGYVALSRLWWAHGDYKRARAVLEDLEHLALQRHFVHPLRARKEAALARLELARGHLATAVNWADANSVTIYENLGYPSEEIQLSLVRVRIAQGRIRPTEPFLSEALRLLDCLQHDAEAKTRKQSLIEILLLRALAWQAQGDHTTALTDLGRALALAQPEGYVRMFLDEGVPMATLLGMLQATAKHAREYVQGLLTIQESHTHKDSRSEHAQQNEQQVHPLLESLSQRELEVLRLIAIGASNAAIADQLVIAVSTVKRHVKNILSKLGATNRTQAATYAQQLGLL